MANRQTAGFGFRGIGKVGQNTDGTKVYLRQYFISMPLATHADLPTGRSSTNSGYGTITEAAATAESWCH